MLIKNIHVWITKKKPIFKMNPLFLNFFCEICSEHLNTFYSDESLHKKNYSQSIIKFLMTHVEIKTHLSLSLSIITPSWDIGKHCKDLLSRHCYKQIVDNWLVGGQKVCDLKNTPCTLSCIVVDINVQRIFRRGGGANRSDWILLQVVCVHIVCTNEWADAYM